jgi:hypothetical protein
VAVQSPDERFAWQLGTIYVWLICEFGRFFVSALSASAYRKWTGCCLASFISTALVLGKLMMSRSRTRRLFTSSHSASNDHLVRHVGMRIIW